MEVNDKLINNIISYFSETKLTDRFKSTFIEELKNDVTFQEKIKSMLESDKESPGDEVLWKKIIESDGNLLSQPMKEKLFRKFEEILHQIVQNTDSSEG